MNIFTKFCLKLLCRFLSLWPRTWVRGLGRPLGILWFDILRVRRKVILNNLKLAFPDWSESQQVRVGRHAVYQMTENFFEILLIPSMNEQWLKDNVVFEGEENLSVALAQKKGAFALSLHLGNGDMAASALSLIGFKMNLVTKVLKNQFLNNLWFELRKAQGVKYIEAHGTKTPFEILKALKSNEVVIFVNDQFMGKPFGILTTFFGHPTGTAYGLALFYVKTRSPILPIYTFIGAENKIHVKIEPALQLDEMISDDKEQTYAQITQEVNNVIERIVRAHPGQWMWVHRRWKKFE